MKNKAKRFRLVKDDDAHDYLIPADRREEFDKWLSSDEAMDGEVPAWAERLSLHPTCYSFTDFKEDR